MLAIIYYITWKNFLWDFYAIFGCMDNDFHPLIFIYKTDWYHAIE